MVQIESRNMCGMRDVNSFSSVNEMMASWWTGNFPIMRDDEVLLVMRDGVVLYCSMGRTEKLSVAKAMSWFYV